MLLLVLGLLVFLGIHSVMLIRPDLRSSMVASMSENAWKGIYSLVSVIGLALIAYGYGAAREASEVLFISPSWSRALALIVMPFALILLMASNFPAGYIKRAIGHPMLWAVIAWAIVHLLVNADTASLVLFGAILIWAVLDLVSASRRPASPPEQIKIWPDILAIALGAFLTWLFIVWAHEWMMGVPII